MYCLVSGSRLCDDGCHYPQARSTGFHCVSIQVHSPCRLHALTRHVWLKKCLKHVHPIPAFFVLCWSPLIRVLFSCKWVLLLQLSHAPHFLRYPFRALSHLRSNQPCCLRRWGYRLCLSPNRWRTQHLKVQFRKTSAWMGGSVFEDRLDI